MKNLIALIVFLFSSIALGQSSEINLIENPGAEFGTARYINVGTGSITKSSDAALGKSAVSFDAAASGDKFQTKPVITPPKIQDVLCTAEFMYKGGDANLKFNVVNGSAAVLKTVVLKAVTKYSPVNLNFICPTSPETVFIEIEATADAAVITMDSFHLGTKTSGVSAVVTEWVDFTNEAVWTTSSSSNLGLDQADVTNAVYRRVGESMEIQFSYSQSVSRTLGAGTFYTFPIPGGHTFDTVTGATGGGSTALGGQYGVGTVRSASLTEMKVIAYNSTHLRFNVEGSNQGWGPGFADNFADTTLKIQFKAKIPIAEWKNQGTVNLLNNSVVGSNARFEAALASTSVPFGSNIKINTSSFNADGISWDNTNSVATINSDGWYDLGVSCNTSYGVSVTFVDLMWSTDSIGSSPLVTARNSTGDTKQPTKNRVLKLSKGDQLYLVSKADGTSNSIVCSAGAQFDHASIVKIADVTSTSAFGFGLADSENAGLVPSYETGSWIPVLSTSATDFSSVTYDTDAQTGTYTKIGNLVTITSYLGWSNTTGSPTGTLAIAGLPYPVSSKTNGFGSIHVEAQNIDFVYSAGSWISGRLNPSETKIFLRSSSDSSSNVSVNASANGGSAGRWVIISGSYFTD